MSVLPDSVRQPLMRAATIIAIIASIAVLLIDPLVTLLVSFGIPLTPDQAGAITTFLQAIITATGVIGVGAAVHGKVTPTAAPVLPSETEVRIEGSRDTVIVRPSPPGSTDIEGGRARLDAADAADAAG